MLQKIAITVHLDKLFKNRLFRIFEEYGVVRSFFFFHDHFRPSLCFMYSESIVWAGK